MSAITDSNGFYTMKLVPGHYSIKVEHLDYEPETFEVDVIANQTVTGSIALKRKKGTLSGEITDEETTNPVEAATVTATKTA